MATEISGVMRKKSQDTVQYMTAEFTSTGAGAYNIFIEMPKRLDDKVWRIMQCAVYHNSGAAKTVTVTWFSPGREIAFQIYSASVATATTTLLTWSGEWKMPQEWELRMSVTPGAIGKDMIFWVGMEAIDA